MNLTLEVGGPNAAELGEARRAIFGEEGGSIGRRADCTWILPDPKVSGRHALISFRNGIFYIQDKSRNGICINSLENRLTRERQYPLNSGDRLLIEPYDIQVSVAKSSAADRPFGNLSDERPQPGPFLQPDPFGDNPFAAPIPVDSSSNEDGPGLLGPISIDDIIKGLGPNPNQVDGPRARNEGNPNVGGVAAQHFDAPVIRPAPKPLPPPPSPPSLIPAASVAAAQIPDEYDALRDNSGVVRFDQASAALARSSSLPPEPGDPPAGGPSPTPAIAPVAPVAPPVKEPAIFQEPAVQPVRAPAAAENAGDLTALVANAGLDPAAATPDLARHLGQILRVVVAGVIDILRARQKIKDEFRIHVTQFRTADNNPLKFSADAEHALETLFVKRNAAFLGPVEAFEDAFEDLKNHQIAMLDGMRVAFESMLAQFDPDRLQEQFDRQLKRGSLLGMSAKRHYWDLYRDLRADLLKDPEESFRKLFADEFARAYEEQLRRLKAADRAERAQTGTRQHSKG